MYAPEHWSGSCRTRRTGCYGPAANDYITEWFRLFCVVAEGPSGVFLCRLIRELGTIKFAYILLMGNVYTYAMLLHGASDVDQRWRKTHHSEQGYAFWGCKQCSFKFWVSNSQIWTFGPTSTVGLSSVNDKILNAYNFNNDYVDYVVIFTWDSHHEWACHVVVI